MSKVVVEVLREAKALIDRPEKWLQSHYERERNGRLCAHGAVAMAETGNASDVHSWKVGRYLVMAVYGAEVSLGIAPWQDDPSTTHADVMAAFDRAIALAEVGERLTDEAYTARFIGEALASVEGEKSLA